ncbi:hypothetical protein Tco_0087155 [Tanacetum coccineum]
MARSYTKELITPFENPKSIFCSKRRLLETLGLVESSSPELNLFSSEEETTRIMTETMEQYMSKTRGNYGGSEHEDANEHIEKFLEIVDLFHIPEKCYNGTSSKTRSTETSDGLAAIQAQLNNLGREIKKVNGKVYAAQYRAARPGLYKCNNGNSLYPDRRQTLEESLTKFMAESAKRYEENSNIIKEIRASTDAAIGNQGASIKTLEIHIGQISKVLQEKGIRGLPGSTEPNPRDHVKLISTTKVDSSEILRMGCSLYAVSGSQHRSIFSEIILFPRRLQNYCCDD